MDDRQLLELAARAAGLEIHWRPNGGPVATIGGVQDWWNPLTDDGDALRLAVALRISVDPRGDAVVAIAADNQIVMMETGTGGLLFHATRRAIVLAAAEIGKALAGEGAGR